MSRLLFIALIAVVVYWLFRAYRKPSGQGAPSAAEDMVRCAHCGVHIPKGESVQAGNDYFCCEAHRLEHGGKP